MKDIYIAAAIATIASIAIIGGILLRKSSRKECLFFVSAFFLLVPMAPVAFYLVRIPLDVWLQGLLGQASETYIFLKTLYAPITEEPIKLWILLIPWFLNNLNSNNAIRLGIAVGLGFGVGEIWLLALELAKNPAIASLPWYLLGGFINERVMVCLMHGVFTATALRQVSKHFPIGLLGAMAMHYLANFPIYLAVINFGGLGKSVWRMILAIWVPFYFLAMVGLLVYFLFGKLTVQNTSLFVNGRAKCPECGTVYIRPIFAISGITKRYERCPACKKWHWTRRLGDRKDVL